MNRKTIWIYLLLSFFLFCNIAAAQIPVSEEPHHKIVLENNYVRILEGHISFRDTTLAHVHTANSVVVFLSKSTFGIQVAGEAPVVTDVNPGDTKYATYGDKPIVHRVWNQSAPAFHFLVVELKKQQLDSDSCSILSQGDAKFQWQQKLVSAYHLDIAKDRPFNLPKSTCAHLLIDISGIITASSAGSINTLRPDGFVFFPPQSDIEIDASNKEDAECVLLELK